MAMLDDYMRTYGDRLQSLLTPASPAVATTTGGNGAQTFPLGTNPAPSMQWEPGAPGSQLETAEPGRAPIRSELAGAGPAGEVGPPVSFAQQWEQTTPKEKTRFVDDLEGALKQGNQTIDSAFDDMVQQLGARPGGKLSRHDKGMLLMEFGLSMMANSRPGVSMGEAIGASGQRALGRHAQMTQGRQQQYDKQRQAIETERAKTKSKLAGTVAVEGVRGERMLAQEQMRGERSDSQLARTVTTEGGDVYGVTRGGEPSALRDPETGEVLRGRQPTGEPLVAVLDENGNEIYMPRSQAAGMKKRPPASQLEKPFGGLKAADTNAIYRQAAGLFGGTYDPMTGRIAGLNREQAETVQGIAARASQIYAEGRGQVDHASATEQAFEEVRSGRRPRTGAGAASALEGNAGTSPGGASQGGPGITQEEYERMPSGTEFRAPDGSIRRKP